MNVFSRSLCMVALAALLGGCASMGSRSDGPFDQAEKNLSGTQVEGLRLARMLRDNGRMEAAAGVYARLDQRGELKGPLLLEYATVAATVSTPREALSLFGRVRQELGGSPQTLPPAIGLAICNGLGRARLMLGQTDAALRDYDCALQLDAANITALNGKAVLLDAQGAHEQAQALWLRAQEIDPADFSILNNLALSYLSQGKTAETIHLLSQLQTDKPMPALVLNLALAHMLDGQDEQAYGVLRRLISENQAYTVMDQLAEHVARIRNGAPASMELLAASREMLALRGEDE